MTGPRETRSRAARPRDEAAQQSQGEPMPRIDSDAIFDGRDAVILVHAGQDYVLRVTRNGKLILNK